MIVSFVVAKELRFLAPDLPGGEGEERPSMHIR
jgi:hypothetical protein